MTEHDFTQRTKKVLNQTEKKTTNMCHTKMTKNIELSGKEFKEAMTEKKKDSISNYKQA